MAEQIPTLGTNSMPDDFDRAMAQLGDGRQGAFSAAMSGFGEFWQAGGKLTTLPWDELEGLPEKDLEDTEYWSLTPEEQVAGSRGWTSLVHRTSPKPAKQTRYVLTRLFGSTRRAKVFVEWVRASTSRKHSDAFRWGRCKACGADIVFYALQSGDVRCQECGVANDSTIHGDEKFSPHMAFARITHINGMQASSFGGRSSQEMPDFEITREA